MSAEEAGMVIGEKLFIIFLIVLGYFIGRQILKNIKKAKKFEEENGIINLVC